MDYCTTIELNILQVCYPLIDKLMDGVDGSSISHSITAQQTSKMKAAKTQSETDAGEIVSCSNIIGLSEVILCYESNDLIVSKIC